MKKLMIVFLLFLAIVAGTIPATNFMYDYGMNHPGKSLSPSLVFTAARIRMNVGNYEVASNWFHNALQYFPYHKTADEAAYWHAYCQEKAKRFNQAGASYQRFIDTYPNHRFVPKAKKRMISM